MSLKEDLQRVYDYDKNEYARAIREQKSYQAELDRTKKDYQGRSWIESPFKLPKFTDAEFEKRRQDYQAKYGTTINIPGFSDIIHLKLPVKITTEEMAAHKWAQKRGLPTPLSPEQLEALQGRKIRFLNALASPTPGWLKDYAAIATFLDDTQDALITAMVMGRLISKASPFLSRLLLPKLGWILLGADILNAVNILGQVTYASMGKKRIIEYSSGRNPFHAKAAAARALKLKQTWPTFGESLEILQTIDSMFGVGLCLGPIIGAAMDVATASTEDLFRWGIKMYGVVNKPSDREKFLGEIIKYGPIIGNSISQLTPEDALSTLTSYIASFDGVWNWWKQNDPLTNIWGLNNMIIAPPAAVSPLNIHISDDLNIKLEPLALWPIINKAEASINELVYTYAPKITDSLFRFALNHPFSQGAMTVGGLVVDTTKKILSTFSDDDTIRTGRTAYADAAVDMAREILQFPPDTPQSMIDELANWIGNYERKTGGSPTTKELEFQGRVIGIKWDRSFPKITFGKAAEAFPEWKRLQDLLKEVSIPD